MAHHQCTYSAPQVHDAIMTQWYSICVRSCPQDGLAAVSEHTVVLESAGEGVDERDGPALPEKDVLNERSRALMRVSNTAASRMERGSMAGSVVGSRSRRNDASELPDASASSTACTSSARRPVPSGRVLRSDSMVGRV